LDTLVIKKMIGFCKAIFPSVGYAYNIIPTYTSGHLGYVIASKTKNAKLEDAIRDPPANCKFYTKEVHKAAFCLPKCYDDVSYVPFFQLFIANCHPKDFAMFNCGETCTDLGMERWFSFKRD
uniref:PABS domain-containing protein n=1 Tax=Hymenolepis diminuta TaxID=6216 RepID=A0A0R3SZG7_HYMDI